MRAPRMMKLSALLSAVTALLIGLIAGGAHAQAPGVPRFFELPDAGGSTTGRTDSTDPATPEAANRIHGGIRATHAQWPSLVFILYKDPGGKSGFACDGTVIAPEWVLTAGHCAGGKAEGYTITEDTDTRPLAEGHKVGVAQVIRHADYQDVEISPGHHLAHNDIALLHLKSRARSPAQVLASGPAEPLAAPATPAWVAGFGADAQFGHLSDQLMQADVPLVGQTACTRIYSKSFDAAMLAKLFDGATVCAGDPNIAKDQCSGDSGGPLNVSDRTTQVGVVSWGACGRPGSVGVYASVGHFEGWIKSHVPGVKFASVQSRPGPAPSPAPTPNPPLIAAIEAAAAALGGRVDIRVDLLEGNRARVGSLIHFHVTSPIAGQLIVYNIDLAANRAYQVFPNRFSGGSAAGATRLQIAAGASVTVPNPNDQFVIRAKEPAGKNRLYAFVLPPNINIADIAEKGLDMQDLVDPEQVFDELATRGVEVIPSATPDRGAAKFEYEVVR